MSLPRSKTIALCGDPHLEDEGGPLITGARGLGIGFGLQNIVNNLASGLNIVFERPLRVRDTGEVAVIRVTGIIYAHQTSADAIASAAARATSCAGGGL